MNPRFRAAKPGQPEAQAGCSVATLVIHDLRHTHATHLLQQRLNVKVAAERLGHADPAITLRVYAHVLQSMQDKAASVTNNLLERAIMRSEKSETDQGQVTGVDGRFLCPKKSEPDW